MRTSLILVAVAGVLIAVLFCFDPVRHAFYPACPSFQWFGFQCATCGGLRAVHALLHGRFAEAWQMNPLVLVVIGVVMLEAVRSWIFGANMRWWFRLAVTVFVSMIAFTLWRNR